MDSPLAVEAEAKLDVGGEMVHMRFPSKRQMVVSLRHFAFETSWLSIRQLGIYRDIKYIVDAGANVGATALMFHLAFPKARILALEPVTVNYEYLVYNTKRFPKIVPLKMGVYSERKRLKLAMPTIGQRPDQAYQIGNTGLFSAYGKGDWAEEVPVDRLDDIVDGPVDLLKLDVEGVEALALQGAERIMSEDRPIVVIETKKEHIEAAGLDAEYYKSFFSTRSYARGGQYFSDPIMIPVELAT